MRYVHTNWKDHGRHFGYPSCCITQFQKDWCAETKAAYPDGPWVGTGFVPCMECAKQAVSDFNRWVASTIAPNRKHRLPFPQQDY